MLILTLRLFVHLPQQPEKTLLRRKLPKKMIFYIFSYKPREIDYVVLHYYTHKNAIYGFSLVRFEAIWTQKSCIKRCSDFKKLFTNIIQEFFKFGAEYKTCKVKVLLQHHIDIVLNTILLNFRMLDTYSNLLTKDLERVCVIIHDRNINSAPTQTWYGLARCRSYFRMSTSPLEERCCSV
jgi:hypothetical protein